LGFIGSGQGITTRLRGGDISLKNLNESIRSQKIHKIWFKRSRWQKADAENFLEKFTPLSTIEIGNLPYKAGSTWHAFTLRNRTLFKGKTIKPENVVQPFVKGKIRVWIGTPKKGVELITALAKL